MGLQTYGCVSYELIVRVEVTIEGYRDDQIIYHASQMIDQIPLELKSHEILHLEGRHLRCADVFLIIVQQICPLSVRKFISELNYWTQVIM